MRITLIAALLALPVLVGCEYRGVGNLRIVNDRAGTPVTVAGADSGKRELTGVFDDVLYRRHFAGSDGFYAITAYRQVTGNSPFLAHYRGYRSDAPFVSVELTVYVRPNGTMARRPLLVLRQGDLILAQGRLAGQANVSSAGKSMRVTGRDMTWEEDGDPVVNLEPSGNPATTHGTVSFEVVAFNVTRGQAPPTAP